jgi:hypothetical protein
MLTLRVLIESSYPESYPVCRARHLVPGAIHAYHLPFASEGPLRRKRLDIGKAVMLETLDPAKSSRVLISEISQQAHVVSL